MEHNNIEKNIQDKLKGYENFDGDKMAMWAAVEEGLGEKKKKRRFFFWFWFGGLALAIGSFSLLLWASSNIELHPSITNTTDLASTSKDTTMANSTKKIDNTTTDETVESTETVIAEPSTKAANTTERKKTRSKSEASTIFKARSTSNNISADLNIDPVADHSSANQNIDYISKDGLNNNLSKEQNNKNNKVATSNTIFGINPLNLPSLFADSILPRLEVQPADLLLSRELQKFVSAPIAIQRQHFRKWSINLAGGISNHNSNYANSELSELRSATETNLLGWQVQLELSREFNRGISLTTGIQFNRAWTKFEFNQERTTEEILENIVTTYHINTFYFTNDTILEYGDASVETETKRDVQHHNRYDRIQIPLLIGKHFQKGRLTFGLQTGVGLDLWMHRSGKVINIDEGISEFNQDDDSDDYNKIGYSLKLRGILGYAITNRTNIYLQPSGNWSLSDWTRSGDELTQKPFTYGVNLGFSFRI